MKKKKKADRCVIRILILADLLIVVIPVLYWYFFGTSHGYLEIRTGELMNQEMRGDSWDGLVIRLNGLYNGYNVSMLPYGLEEMNEKFPGNFQPGNRVWALCVTNRRLIRPEIVRPVWIMKLSGKYKRWRRPYITKWNICKETEHMDKSTDLTYNSQYENPGMYSDAFRMLQVPKGFIEKPV